MSTSKKSTKSAAEAAKKNGAAAAFFPLYTKNVERLAELQKKSLDIAAEQNGELVDACKKAFSYIPEAPGSFLFELAGQSFNRFVETQKGAIDLAVEQSQVVAGLAARTCKFGRQGSRRRDGAVQAVGRVFCCNAKESS